MKASVLKRKPDHQRTTVRVSVVVPTYRRPDLLDRCLQALARQSLASGGYEILVADDAASPATREQVRKFARHSEVRVAYVAVKGRHGPAAARNAGWRAARGEIIAFTDDDCVPDRDWLHVGLGALEADAAAAAVSGRVVVPLPERPTDYELDAAGLERAEFVTANCFCRRAVLEALGGFDERFALAWREDSDLQFSLLQAGHKIVPVSGAVVIHPVRAASWAISLRQQRKVLFDALLYKKHPVLYRGRLRRRPPWHYYGALGACILALAGAAAGAPEAAMVGAGAWALLTARFCALRLRHTSHSARHVAEMALTSALIPFLSVYWRLYGAAKFRVFFF